MIDITPNTVLAVFLIFCRVGGCLMVVPGFASAYVPARVRLFIAVAVTLALSPLFLPAVEARLGDGAPATMFSLIVTETMTGFVIGFIGRIFFAALQFIGSAATQAIGLSAMPGTVVEDDGQQPSIATLFTLTATTLLFVMGLHWEILRGLMDSYDVMPPGQGIGVRLALTDMTDQLTEAFLLAVRIGSPFLVFSLIVNFAVGITNKLTPQVPVFFIAMPFVTAGGLILLFFVVKDFMLGFMAAFGAWLAAG